MTEKRYIATLAIEPGNSKFKPIALKALDDETAIQEMKRRLILFPPPINDDLTTVRVGVVCKEDGDERIVHQFVFSKRKN